MEKITPFLWFDGQAEEAMNFYVATFKNSRVRSVRRVPGTQTVISATFELEGRTFHALNGGPRYQLTPAISFLVDCDGQVEVDALWDRLCADGGRPEMCGWLRDKFGVSWQIIPKALGRLLGSEDSARAQRAMAAMLKMQKIVIADLEAAAHGV